MPATVSRVVDRVRRAAMLAYRHAPMPVRRLVIRLIAPTFTVGAVVVVRRSDGALLMVEQRHTGAWALPGGLLQRGEDAATAAAREVAEEVGIEIDPRDLRTPRTVLDPRRRSIDLVFFHELDHPGRAHRNDPIEVTRVAWFSPAELPSLTEPTVGIVGSLDLCDMHPFGS